MIQGREIDLAILRAEGERRETIRKFDWAFQTEERPGQRIPEGDWRIWLILAGRGWGKTRVGAETVRIWSEEFPRVSLIGRTISDVRDLMIEGISGLQAVFPSWRRIEWIPSRRLIRFPSGSIGKVFTSDEPEMLRGPEHMKIWADEVAAWVHPQETWDMSMLGLRQGSSPQCVATTTPKPIPLVRDLKKRAGLEIDPRGRVVLSAGSTYENEKNLAPEFLGEILGAYEGTRLGKQEIHAEVLEDVEGALWRSTLIDPWRIDRLDVSLRGRTVVSVDPAASTGEDSDETGIIATTKIKVCPFPHQSVPLEGGRPSGVGGCYAVLADRSGRWSPDVWARRSLDLLDEIDGDRIIGERNNGGDMVEAVIRHTRRNAPLKTIHASKGKEARAEPVVALYEQGRVHHVGLLPSLEDEMVVFPVGEGHDDRVDALVYGLTELSGPKRSLRAF